MLSFYTLEIYGVKRKKNTYGVTSLYKELGDIYYQKSLENIKFLR